MSTLCTRIICFLLCLVPGLAPPSLAHGTSLTIAYSSNSYGILAPCPS